MNTKSKKENVQLYKCPECRLNYKEKEWMNKCEAWCKEHHSCNLEITRFQMCRHTARTRWPNVVLL
jgi:hypothetical protein